MESKTIKAIIEVQQELSIVWITIKVCILIFTIFTAMWFLFATFTFYMVPGTSFIFAVYVGLKYMDTCINKVESTIITGEEEEDV